MWEIADMDGLIVVLLLALNFGISWWNCYAVGSSWDEAKREGGFAYLICWCGAVQSVAGFSMAILFPVVWITTALGLLPEGVARGANSLWYLMIIFPAIGSGLAITLHSWQQLIRDRSPGNFLAAGWNTYASIQNIYDATQMVPKAWGDLSGLFDFDADADDGPALAVIILVFVLAVGALIGGAFITSSLIGKYRRRASIEIGALVRQAENSRRSNAPA
jgi:polyferredoxin